MRKERYNDMYLEDLITITYLKMTFNFAKNPNREEEKKYEQENTSFSSGIWNTSLALH